MSITSTVHVDLGERAYDIRIGPDLLERGAELLAPIASGRRVVVVTDERVASTHLGRLAPALDTIASGWSSVTIAAGEGTKSFAGIESLLLRLLDEGVDRDCVLVAFGGGVVGDVAGFAAGVFMRGIDLVQIPTTLLSQVDSSVGGKNGINTRHGKNLVGTFHQPRLVLNDTTVLATLPERELRSGYAEIVKSGLLRGESEFAWLEEHVGAVLSLEPTALVEAVRLGCETKARVVIADERDKGQRAFVNLGHTFAHALETEAGHGAMLHGEAVAAGLPAAARLSARLGHCDDELAGRVRIHLEQAGLPPDISKLPTNHVFPAGAVYDHMQHDKKTVDGDVRFVLLRGIGEPFVEHGIAREVVLDVLLAEGARG